MTKCKCNIYFYKNGHFKINLINAVVIFQCKCLNLIGTSLWCLIILIEFLDQIEEFKTKHTFIKIRNKNPFIKIKKYHNYANLIMSKLTEDWWEYCFRINYVKNAIFSGQATFSSDKWMTEAHDKSCFMWISAIPVGSGFICENCNERGCSSTFLNGDFHTLQCRRHLSREEQPCPACDLHNLTWTILCQNKWLHIRFRGKTCIPILLLEVH